MARLYKVLAARIQFWSLKLTLNLSIYMTEEMEFSLTCMDSLVDADHALQDQALGVLV